MAPTNTNTPNGVAASKSLNSNEVPLRPLDLPTNGSAEYHASHFLPSKQALFHAREHFRRSGY